MPFQVAWFARIKIFLDGNYTSSWWPHRMAKAIFTTKVEPTCDDLPEFRYHFLRSYLRLTEAAVGD